MLQFIFILLLGYGLQAIFNLNAYFQNASAFTEIAIFLLVIGLYASVYEIDVQILKRNVRIVFAALTLGIFLKSIFIGGILYIFTGNTIAFLLGVVVAQIDPLSVSYLLRNKDGSFSPTGRTILRVWSSFDDPVTVLLSLFLIGPLNLGTFHDSQYAYIQQLLFNLLYAGSIFLITKYFLKKDGVKQQLLLLICIILAIIFHLTLGVAIIALFLRPTLDKVFFHGVTIAFYIAIFLLGLTMTVSSTILFYGVSLGLLGYISQIIAAFCVGRGLTREDKLHLSLAQYNGITSVSLGLYFQSYFSDLPGIVAFAVITINTLYYIMNHWGYKFLSNTRKV